MAALFLFFRFRPVLISVGGDFNLAGGITRE